MTCRDSHHTRKEVHWPPPLVVPEHLEDMAEIPDSFKCPITFAIMKEPATTRNGKRLYALAESFVLLTSTD